MKSFAKIYPSFAFWAVLLFIIQIAVAVSASSEDVLSDNVVSFGKDDMILREGRSEAEGDIFWVLMTLNTLHDGMTIKQATDKIEGIWTENTPDFEMQFAGTFEKPQIRFVYMFSDMISIDLVSQQLLPDTWEQMQKVWYVGGFGNGEIQTRRKNELLDTIMIESVQLSTINPFRGKYTSEFDAGLEIIRTSVRINLREMESAPSETIESIGVAQP